MTNGVDSREYLYQNCLLVYTRIRFQERPCGFTKKMAIESFGKVQKIILHFGHSTGTAFIEPKRPKHACTHANVKIKK